jgi:hypothetical protein
VSHAKVYVRCTASFDRFMRARDLELQSIACFLSAKVWDPNDD